jgi:hypothetical protein
LLKCGIGGLRGDLNHVVWLVCKICSLRVKAGAFIVNLKFELKVIVPHLVLLEVFDTNPHLGD